VQCVVCAAVGKFNSNEDGFLVCQVCGTQAANVANESSDLADTGHIVERLLQRKAAAPAVRPTRGGAGRKRRRNVSPSPPPHAAAPPVERDSQAACLWVTTVLLRAQTRALAAATGEHWLEEQVKSLWARYASMLVAPTLAAGAAGDDGNGSEGRQESTGGRPSRGGSVRLAALPSPECVVALCCIALRQSRSAVQVPEVVRHCLTGRVPFYGAFDGLDPAVRTAISSEHYGEVRPLRLLTCSSLGAAMSKVQTALQIDHLAPPNVQAAVRRYCEELMVPPAVVDVAGRLVRAVPIESWCTDATSDRVGITSFPVAVAAMAYVFAALKCVYGLDGATEYGRSKPVVPLDCGDTRDLQPIGKWLDAVGESRLGDTPGSVAVWSVAAATAATSHNEVFRLFSTSRVWQSVGSCYTDASRWSSSVEVADSQLQGYLRWAGDVLVPESRRTTFRQKHCLQLHDFGETFERLAPKWSASPAAGAAAAAAAGAAADVEEDDSTAETPTTSVPPVGKHADGLSGGTAAGLMSTSAVVDAALSTHGDVASAGILPRAPLLLSASAGVEAACSNSSERDSRYTRLGHAAPDDEGVTCFPEALRVVARVLASHVLESDALLYQALHVLETEALAQTPS
jgi:hypothetical protein